MMDFDVAAGVVDRDNREVGLVVTEFENGDEIGARLQGLGCPKLAASTV